MLRKWPAGLHVSRGEITAATGFYAVERHVGVFPERAGVAAVKGGAGDADAYAGLERSKVGDEKRRDESIDNAFGDDRGFGGVIEIGQNDGEFVPADTCDGVDLAELLVSAVREELEGTIADLVAVGVVDRFELVEVEEEVSDGRAMAGSVDERL